MRLSNSPNPLIGFLYVLLLVGSIAALVFSEQLAWFFVLVLLVLLLLLLWWLFFGGLGKPEYPPQEFFIQDEVIVRGPQSAVTTAVQTASASVTLVEKDRIEFKKLSEVIKNCLGHCSPLDYNDLVIILYKLDGTKDAVSAAIRSINQAVGPGSSVRAEPNWISGRRFAVAGEGIEPWDPTGSGEGVLETADPDLFMKQWAFNQIDLHGRNDDLKGSNVRIGFFDTSPFQDAASSLLASSLAWVNEPEPLKLDQHYDDYLEDNSKYIPDQSDHGLFSAGITHAVAPRAEKHLYRVLNDDNKGDLFALMKAIFDFVRRYAAEKFPDDEQKPKSELSGAVINLSLGIRLLPEDSGINLPAELQAFRDLLLAARCAGIVVVAAAGNDSTGVDGHLPASLPANWPEVIGVAASNHDGKATCFSNEGNLGAPGGDCVEIKEKSNALVVAPGQCQQSQDCRHAVVGPVLKKEENTGFGFWAGTSFASPMVAGLAALVIECGRGQLSPDEVRSIIENGAVAAEGNLGRGIINIPKTLAYCIDSGDDVKDRPDQQYDEDIRQSAE